MKRETLKEYIDNIIIKKCGFEKTFFSTKSDDGQNMIVHKDILFDPLDAYEVLSEIERKCGILINDDLEWYCPNCGNKDHNLLNVARRTCGYIGTNFWNKGRTEEIKDRVLHIDNKVYKL